MFCESLKGMLKKTVADPDCCAVDDSALWSSRSNQLLMHDQYSPVAAFLFYN